MRIRRMLFIVLLAVLLLSGCTPAATPPPQLGSTMVSPKDGMTMDYVPEGEFPMGSKEGLLDERPQHTVFLDAFWIDQTEVTNAMYRKCVDAGACGEPGARGTWRDEAVTKSYFTSPEYDDHPVVFVSWVDANSYCSWAGRRLPTEAEWEKAATWDPVKNEKREYPWGNEFDCHKGNFDDETELDPSLMPKTEPGCDGFVRSSPVGSFPQGASPYGALDMGGNAWEWVHDAFIEVDPLIPTIQNYYAISPEKNPQGIDPAISEYRSVRGGSWNFTFGFGRADYRLWHVKDDRYDGLGFRCAVSATP